MPITIRGNCTSSGRTYDTRAQREKRRSERALSEEAGASTATSSRVLPHNTPMRRAGSSGAFRPVSRGRGGAAGEMREEGASAPVEISPLQSEDSDDTEDLDLE
eukprot:GHVU01201916.1.p3 GENE.GHVU01201916.1~~GHVU01201916.1.p3  ORF type:complete len:104 (-),score=10.94 GHVU01201916.1:344-655(-)